jgi:hypothetical protein
MTASARIIVCLLPCAAGPSESACARRQCVHVRQKGTPECTRRRAWSSSQLRPRLPRELLACQTLHPQQLCSKFFICAKRASTICCSYLAVCAYEAAPTPSDANSCRAGSAQSTDRRPRTLAGHARGHTLQCAGQYLRQQKTGAEFAGNQQAARQRQAPVDVVQATN